MWQSPPPRGADRRGVTAPARTTERPAASPSSDRRPVPPPPYPSRRWLAGDHQPERWSGRLLFRPKRKRQRPRRHRRSRRLHARHSTSGRLSCGTGDQRRRVVKGPPAKAASRRAGGTASSSRGSATAPRAFPALTQRMHLQTVSPLPRSRCARSGVPREPDDRGKR